MGLQALKGSDLLDALQREDPAILGNGPIVFTNRFLI